MILLIKIWNSACKKLILSYNKIYGAIQTSDWLCFNQLPFTSIRHSRGVMIICIHQVIPIKCINLMKSEFMTFDIYIGTRVCFCPNQKGWDIYLIKTTTVIVYLIIFIFFIHSMHYKPTKKNLFFLSIGIKDMYHGIYNNSCTSFNQLFPW